MTSNTIDAGRLGRARFRRSLALALALSIALIAAFPASGLAQEAPKSYKKWYFGVGGALLVGVPVYLFASDRGLGNSACSSQGCVTALAALIGGAIGFMIGAEKDRSYVRRMAAGPTLDYEYHNVPLDLVPDRITKFPGGAAVVGVGGVRIVTEDGTVHPRGSGVRGIDDVAVIPDLDLLVLSTYSNLIGFAVYDDSAQGHVIDERGGGALEVFQSDLAVAGLDSLRLIRVRRDGTDIDTETLAQVASSGYVTDMAFSGFGRLGWVLMENRLASYNASFEKIGEVELPAAGHAVRARGSRLAVSAGTNGVFVVDVRDPAAPRVVQRYTGVKFAYAADLDGDRLYVAAGPEGVAVVDISGDEPKVIGVARRTKFASDVIISGTGEAWILDREAQMVQIVDLGVESR